MACNKFDTFIHVARRVTQVINSIHVYTTPSLAFMYTSHPLLLSLRILCKYVNIYAVRCVCKCAPQSHLYIYIYIYIYIYLGGYPYGL